MKKFLLPLVLTVVIGISGAMLLIPEAVANSGYSCRTDSVGNYVCRGTGDNSGHRTTTRRDSVGNDITTDNRGNRRVCRTDSVGNYVCRNN